MALLPATAADGNVRLQFVPTIADVTAPTASELNAAGAKDISCYVTASGYTTGGDQATISDDRLCDTQTYEQPGRKSRTMQLTFIENPTAPSSNVAAITLAEGTNGFIVERRGIAYGTAFVAAQKVDIWPIKAGMQMKLAPEANSVLRIQQKEFVTGPVTYDVAVAS